MEMGDALIFKPEDLARLAAGGDFKLGFTVKGGHLNLSTESSLSKVDWQLIDDVIAISLKKLMLFNCQSNVQVTRGAASGSGLTFTPESYLRVLINPGWDFD